MQENKDLEGFFNYGRKYSSDEEYYKRKYPGLFISDLYVSRLIKNKNFRNAQNYVIKKNNSLENLEFEGKYVRIQRKIKFYKYNFIKIFLDILFKRNNKNIVFLLNYEYSGIYNLQKIYLVINKKYYKLFFNKNYILGLKNKIDKLLKR